MRIREVETERFLMDMHGLYYKMSPEFRPGSTGGLAAYVSHLKMTPDFCTWQDRLVLAGDEDSSMGHRHRFGGQPQSVSSSPWSWLTERWTWCVCAFFPL